MINFDLTKDTNDIQLDADGNFLTTKTRIKDIAQLIVNRLQTFLGEIPTNLAKGVDYHGIIFDEFLTQQSKINELVRVIVETDGVEGIEDFSFSPDKDIASYDFVIKTDAGNINFNELL
jgi:hypothetical protein